MTKSSMRSSRYLVSVGGEFGLREQYETLLPSGGLDPKPSASCFASCEVQQLRTDAIFVYKPLTVA
jgi:hypothetical protein